MTGLVALTLLVFSQPPGPKRAAPMPDDPRASSSMAASWDKGLTGSENPGLVGQGRASSSVSGSFGATSPSGAADRPGLTILSPDVYEEQDTEPLLPEYHVVAPGETLWELTGKYYRNPYAWPLMWSINEQMTNPHWIFPGDQVRVREGDGTGRSAAANSQGQQSGVRYVQGKAAAGAAPSYLVQRSFFLFDKDHDRLGKVVGANRPSVMVADGDQVYLTYDKSNPPVPGERLAIYEPTQKIHDYRKSRGGRKRKGKVLARLVQVVAEVEIESLGERSAVGTIVDALRPVERGMWVGPLQARFERMAHEAATVSRSGVVVTCLDGHDMSGQRQLVVLDLGQNEGARRGNLVEVTRHGDAYAPVNQTYAKERKGHPARFLARLVIVDTTEKASLAMVVDAKQEILPGDPVELRAQTSAKVPSSRASLSGRAP